MKKVFIEVFGWYGTVAIVGAYALNSFGIISANGIIYQLLNMTGAIGIIAVSFHKKVFQSVVLNVIWLVIAIIAIIKLFA